MLIFGIDPGLSSPGAAALRPHRFGPGYDVVELPVLRSLDELLQWLVVWVDSCNNSSEKRVVAVENVVWSLHAKVGRGPGSGRILESVGAARMFAASIKAELVEVSSLTCRKTLTGSGRATKEQVREAVKRRVTGWPKGQVGLNRSDAAAIAIVGAIGARKLGHRVEKVDSVLGAIGVVR